MQEERSNQSEQNGSALPDLSWWLLGIAVALLFVALGLAQFAPLHTWWHDYAPVVCLLLFGLVLAIIGVLKLTTRTLVSRLNLPGQHPNQSGIAFILLGLPFFLWGLLYPIFPSPGYALYALIALSGVAALCAFVVGGVQRVRAWTRNASNRRTLSHHEHQ